MLIYCKKDDLISSDISPEFNLAIGHRSQANLLYRKIYFSKNPDYILNYLNQITTVYPFFRESLFSMWIFFKKLHLFKKKHVHNVLQYYFKYMNIYSKCKYNQIFYINILNYLSRNTSSSFQDDLLSIFFDLYQRIKDEQMKQKAIVEISKQIIYCINEQTTHLSKIKKCLDVIRDQSLNKIDNILIYANITLIGQYTQLKIYSLAISYFLKILEQVNLMHVYMIIPRETKELLDFLLQNKKQYGKYTKHITKHIDSMIKQKILSSKYKNIN